MQAIETKYFGPSNVKGSRIKAKAVDALNEAIKAAGPVCWWEDEIAIDVADLRSRIARVTV